MTIEETVLAAIKGGWGGFYAARLEDFSPMVLKSHWAHGAITLNPAFWQCLSNSLGLGGAEWHYLWRALIDHLAEGKTIESFFETL